MSDTLMQYKMCDIGNPIQTKTNVDNEFIHKM